MAIRSPAAETNNGALRSLLLSKPERVLASQWVFLAFQLAEHLRRAKRSLSEAGVAASTQ
jgi:hypothetical protein